MMGRGVKRQEKGVTLIELVIVMAIIGIMALFMTPSIGEWAALYRVKGAAKDIADTLQLARLKAISTGNQYRVQLNLNNGSDAESFALQVGPAWTTDGTAITLPRGVNIDRVDPGAIQAGTVDRTFNTNGTATGWAGSATSIIYLENQRNDQYRIIISQTGMVKMREGW
jgi:prepilin-type N-terminal cleavage/methylation domain-containing protein